MDNAKKKLTFIGRDFWDHPVYEDQNGKLWKDIDCGSGIQGTLYSVIGNDFDGEPNLPMKKDIECEFIPERIVDTAESEDERFRCMLLSRMQSDCEYHLGYGNRAYIKDEQAHIAYMKELWNSFPENNKPEWLSFEKIEEYERAMKS